MISEEDQHHRLLHGLQLLRQPHHGVHGVGYPVEVVVPDVAALLAEAGVGGGQVLHRGGEGGLIGPVVLVGHGEGEAGAILHLVLQLVGQLGHQNVVRVVDGRQGRDQRLVVVVGEPLLLKAQVFVDVLAVIEPAVARVAEHGLVALAAEVPDVGVGGLAEVVVGGIAGEEAPLAVHGASGEDVGEQVARHRLLLQLVPRLVGLHHRLGLSQNRQVGEVAEGLQHDAHDADLLLRGDVLVGEGRQQGLGVSLVVALRGCGEHLPEGVEEGVDTALGHKDLHIGPLVDEAVVCGFLVEGGAEVPAGEGHSHEGQAAQRAEGPVFPVPQAFGHEEDGEQQTSHEAENGEPGQPGDVQGVASHDAARLGGQTQVGGQQGVGSQADFEVVHHGNAHDGQEAEQEARPGPAEQEVAQPDKGHGGQQVQRQNDRVGEIGVENGQGVKLCVGGGGVEEAQPADAAAHGGEGDGQPYGMRPGQPGVGSLGQAHNVQQSLHGL